MKRFILPLTLLITCQVIKAQNSQESIDTEEVIRRVADRIVASTSFKFINKNTKEKFDAVSKLKPMPEIAAESDYNRWGYPNGVMMTGLIHMADILQDKKYADYCRNNYQFIFNDLLYFEKLYKDAVSADERRVRTEFSGLFRMAKLDDCGAMAAGLSDVYLLDSRKDYRAYLDRAGDYILNKQMRLADGTLCRPDPRNATIWADDLYMSVPFLARMGKITGDEKYFNDAIKQVVNFTKYLYDDHTGLFYHCYYSANEQNGVAHWGRANGWVAVAQTELLNNLPTSHPKRKELITLLEKDIIGFSRWQNQTGLWHQVLDRNDSYLETSVTAMYIYAVARAVNEGWIDEHYIRVARDGWRALANKITEDGQMPDVCVGTGIQDGIKFYYNRPTKLNDNHGLGPFLLAGTEVFRYEKNNPNRR
ncbi:glycoside hydrolase family 88/105 protein [Thalassobellus suaedae]|uniref:Glycoside hydrolase family 88 protein n=1 Tax=Thalassobellus suaedae TaxID=3074124 RepID=A0ABY9Y4A9_9FLAO|nr:glycoside hydrolase family 88 protein [Flavobacteriaceae bacterium HL-DH10]